MLKRISPYLFISLFLFGVWNSSMQKAAIKPFWTDEFNELNYTCRSSYTDMILDGSRGQCSAPPLYYMVSKFFFNLYKIHEDDPIKDILINTRIVSRVSLILLLLVLIIIYKSYLGMVWKWLPLILFVFFDYLGSEDGHVFWASTETRLYGFWIFMTGLNLLTLHIIEQNLRKDEKIPNLQFYNYCIVSFLLMVTSSPGMIQVFIPLVLVFSLWDVKKFKSIIEPNKVPGLLILLVGLCIVIYYNIREVCHVEGYYDNTWGTVAEYFTGYRTPVMFMIMICGWIYTFENMNDIISRMIFSQFTIMVAMIILIHVLNYHFIPRVLIMCHFLSFYLGVAGCKQISKYLELNLGMKRNLFNIVIYIIIIAVSIFHSESLKGIIKHGILLRPMSTKEKIVYQRNNLIFPLCSVKK